MPTFLGLGSYILTQGLWASAYLQRDVCLTTYVIKVEALVRDLVTESTPREQRKSKQGERFLHQRQPGTCMSGDTTWRPGHTGLMDAL